MARQPGAGDLREQIRIGRQVTASDGAGGQARSWVDGEPLRAQVLPFGAGDAEAVADGLAGVQGYKIMIRFGPAVDIDDRITWRDRVLTVLGAVDDTGRRRFLTITTDRGGVTG